MNLIAARADVACQRDVSAIDVEGVKFPRRNYGVRCLEE
jgi:hypothetical protein